MPYTHEDSLRVHYAETDQMGVVYNGNYFIYFEIGRVEFCRTIGLHYEQMLRPGRMLRLRVVKAAIDWSLYAVVRVSLLLLRWTPRCLAYPICRTIARWVGMADSKHRLIGMVNLAIAFPDRSIAWRRKVLLDSFEHLGDQAVELSRLPGMGSGEMRRRVRYDSSCGLANYLEAHASGKGVLFVTAHLSAWELLPAAHAARGYPLTFLVRRLDNPWLDRWSETIRCRFGNRVVDKRRALRKVMKLIQERKDVGFLLDQNVQESEGVYAPLFGRPASTSSSVAALAVRTGAPVVLGFLCPDSRLGFYRIRFYPALYARPEEESEIEVLRLTAEINRHIEEVIREFPSHWLWGHRRFQTQPDGEQPYG